jgi:hypothetical protein
MRTPDWKQSGLIGSLLFDNGPELRSPAVRRPTIETNNAVFERMLHTVPLSIRQVPGISRRAPSTPRRPRGEGRTA